LNEGINNPKKRRLSHINVNQTPLRRVELRTNSLPGSVSAINLKNLPISDNNSRDQKSKVLKQLKTIDEENGLATEKSPNVVRERKRILKRNSSF
jgi:hypothetical protein